MKSNILPMLFGLLFLSGIAYSSCYDVQDACYQRCCGDNVGSWENLNSIGVGEGECDSTSYCARVGRWACLMQSGYGSRDAFYSCAQSCIEGNGCGGDWIGDSGSSATQAASTPPAPSEPACSGRIGTFESVSGSPKITRNGVQFTATAGGKYCLDDQVQTSTGEKVLIDFGDGNKRFISNGGWMQITSAELNGEPSLATNAYGVMELLLSDAPAVSHDVVIGCRLPSSSSCDASVAYVPHSYLRCEFGPDGDRITVIEGQLEAVDMGTGESVFVDSGNQYYRMAGESAQEGRTRAVDLSTVPQEIGGGGSCCGTAFILMLVPLLAFAYRS
jgi:hypothetical protein